MRHIEEGRQRWETLSRRRDIAITTAQFVFVICALAITFGDWQWRHWLAVALLGAAWFLQETRERRKGPGSRHTGMMLGVGAALLALAYVLGGADALRHFRLWGVLSDGINIADVIAIGGASFANGALSLLWCLVRGLLREMGWLARPSRPLVPKQRPTTMHTLQEARNDTDPN